MALLVSMTGFGEAHCVEDTVAVAVEVRCTNNRYFKLALKCTEGYGALEAEIESVIRRRMKRGTVQATLRVDRPRSADEFQLNLEVLAGYRRQLQQLPAGEAADEVPLATLLLLPGVVTEPSVSQRDPARDWPVIGRALEAALADACRMKSQEGRAMEADLRANCAAVARELAAIEDRAPQVSAGLQVRMLERLKETLSSFNVAIVEADVLKEASLIAERSDISEEITRLKSHLAQFEQTLSSDESPGRKLDFLTQEILRETNTIGAKASDVGISRNVIEIKTAVERLREMVQNVE